LVVRLGVGASTNIVLENTGPDELRHLVLLEVRNGLGRFLIESRVPGRDRVSLELSADQGFRPLKEVADAVGERMSRALVSDGLFEREAEAMVNTWRESWLEEEGLRVLYILPRKWTDEVLPLKLNPEPRHLVRTMVGRAEIITPGMEWEILRQIVRFADGDEASRSQAVERAGHLGLGRFLEPAMRRVLGSHPSQEFSQAGWNLMNTVANGRAGINSVARQ
jgi:hypothetical protein